MARKRFFLDLLVEGFPDIPRERLLAFVLCGHAWAAGEKLRDPKRLLPADTAVGLHEPDSQGQAVPQGVPPLPFVSRGGFKLDAALRAWHPELSGRVWLDAGSSTGGFTHALLLAGAAQVHAVDVGYNLIDWRLRSCSRVILHERCNFQGLSRLEPTPFGAVADLSFRSLQGAARTLLELVSGNLLIALIKPQFELGFMASPGGDREEEQARTRFNGIIRDEALTWEILDDLARRLAMEQVVLRQVMPSPIKGGQGNQEYLAWLEVQAGDESRLVRTSRHTLGAAGLQARLI